jgi:hypothetical protein
MPIKMKKNAKKQAKLGIILNKYSRNFQSKKRISVCLRKVGRKVFGYPLLLVAVSLLFSPAQLTQIYTTIKRMKRKGYQVEVIYMGRYKDCCCGCCCQMKQEHQEEFLKRKELVVKILRT